MRHLALDLSGYKPPVINKDSTLAAPGGAALNQSTTNSLGGNPKVSLFQDGGSRIANKTVSAAYEEGDEMMDYDEGNN